MRFLTSASRVPRPSATSGAWPAGRALVRCGWRAVIVALLVGVLPIGPGVAVAQDTASRSLVIRGATVIDPSSGRRPRTNRTIVIVDGVIRAVGAPDSVTIPEGVRIYDARGRYAIPGLWDMHVHFQNTAARALPLLVANGVTSVREMGGGGSADSIRAWQVRIAAGTLVGPRIMNAGPNAESPGGPAATGRTAGAANRLDASDSGRKIIEHEFMPPLSRLDSASRAAVYKRFVQNGTWYAPTLVASRRSFISGDSATQALFGDSAALRNPRRRFASPSLLAFWRRQAEERRADSSAARSDSLREAYHSSLDDVRAMREAGVRLLAGTDAGSLLVYPGFSLHEELRLLVREAGLTPREALWSATVGPSEFFGMERTVGRIARGQVADIVLLNADPLADIRNTRHIQAVVQGGRLFTRAALRALLLQARSPGPS